VGAHVDSMVCDPGCADVIVAFEAVEALRAQQLLAEGGRLFVNDEQIVPVSVNIGNFAMPTNVNARLASMGAKLIPAGRIARELGSPRSTNVVLVGALSTALDFDEALWRDTITKRVPPGPWMPTLPRSRQDEPPPANDPGVDMVFSVRLLRDIGGIPKGRCQKAIGLCGCILRTLTRIHIYANWCIYQVTYSFL